jgi:hypothetical protein
MDMMISAACAALLIGILVGGRIKLPEVKKFEDIKYKIKDWYKKYEDFILNCAVLGPFYFGLVFLPIGRFAFRLSWKMSFAPMFYGLAFGGFIIVMIEVSRKPRMLASGMN